MPTTRLAPSPTGALHLGNARTFLVNWALARQNGWRVVLRIEDLDGPRIKARAAEQAIALLGWLGLDWDEGPYYQTTNLKPYREALLELITEGHAFPCRCTRSQILAASLSAPHAGQHELHYNGLCRPRRGTRADLSLLDDPDYAWRLVTPNGEVLFHDELLGPQAINPQLEVGDFLVATKGGLPSYQLAVVVDDLRHKVDRIVRGDDLLSSTARQILVRRRLGAEPPIEYWHLPLVVGQDGRRLAKRHGDSRLDTFRQNGATPERVVGLLAEWCGLGPREEMTAVEFVKRFHVDGLPREQVVYSESDGEWLCDS